jgi:septal ring factor EnvC (AmiA/AmiB activator)
MWKNNKVRLVVSLFFVSALIAVGLSLYTYNENLTLREQVTGLQRTLAERDAGITERDGRIAEHDSSIAELRAENEALKQTVIRLEQVNEAVRRLVGE